tara:strand:+ start:106 stop:750 length:645 start_codon:yes stop_codon:yes gene_type:complete
MKELDQDIIKFDYDKSFKDEDFYISKSNESALIMLNKWPRWEKKFLNIYGERHSGKTHLVNIFLKKFKGLKLEANELKNDDLKKIKLHENIVIENLGKNIDEKFIYTIFNFIDQENKYLIITSIKSIAEINFDLNDLRSRAKNFILQDIKKPDDKLMFALIFKSLSDRQISLDQKLISYIIKRIERSYGEINDFIYKIDELSLKKKKIYRLKIN